MSSSLLVTKGAVVLKLELLGLVLIGLLASTTLHAQAPSNPQATTKKEDASPSQKYFSDTELIDQNGRVLRFYTDLLKDKIVVMSSFLGSCRSACPIKHRNLQKIQEAAGERLGKDVVILSISVDPVTDTPEHLKEYAKAYDAKPGWYFLSGKKENIDWILRKIGQYVEDKHQHLNIVIMGNEPTGLWKKAFGLAAADELIKVFRSVLDDKPATKAN